MSLKETLHREKFRKKSARGFRGYPVATVAYYGPTDQRATKVVVSVVPAEGVEAKELHKWFCDTWDVRTGPVINEEIFRLLSETATKSVASYVSADRPPACCAPSGQ